jgi:phage shock protein PspC (stress-responsive transcriptional regulator)
MRLQPSSRVTKITAPGCLLVHTYCTFLSVIAMASEPPSRQRLYRSEHDRVLAGVAGGLGEYFQVDSNLVRLVFVVLAVSGGAGLLLYIIAWVLIPSEGELPRIGEADIKAGVAQASQEVRERLPQNGSTGLAVGLILLGIIFLMATLGVYSFDWLGRLWPLILILIGWQLYTRSDR